MTRSVDDGGLGPWATRWRDDMIALVDFLYSDHAARSVLASILNRTVLEDLGYFGMSYGAAAAVSAAQVDHRAKAAINFDGTHWLSDVLGEDVRTPLLVLTSEDPVTYSNEFFFEPLTTMGTREDIVRIKLQPEATHMELSDIMFLPAAARQAQRHDQYLHPRVLRPPPQGRRQRLPGVRADGVPGDHPVRSAACPGLGDGAPALRTHRTSRRPGPARWLGGRDSNPDSTVQSRMSYR